jgi:hypothetical protein
MWGEDGNGVRLTQARLEALQSMNAFTTSGVSGGLLGKIDELERTIPEARTSRTVERSAHALHSESNRSEIPPNGNPGSTTSGKPAGNTASTSSASLRGRSHRQRVAGEY